MRITFITPFPNASGGIRVVATYAERLSQRGHDVLIVHPSREPLTLRQRYRSLRSRIAGRASPHLFRPLRSHFDGLDVERRILPTTSCVTADDVPDADVVVATWWETAEWVATFPPKKGAKVYFLQHYEIHDFLPIERVKNTWTLPMHKLVICQWLADVARLEYGDENVSLVPNSVDTKLFTAPPRSKQPIPTVGTMYSIAGFKGCDIALKAVEIARRDVPELRLLTYGLVRPIPGMPLPPDTEFSLDPPQDMLPAIYAGCDAWLFASRSEGFGLPILEAMACRTPVIGTPAGAAPDFLKDGRGILLKGTQPEEMAEAIVTMCRLSQEDWRAMSDRAYACISKYTWDDATDGFERALKTARRFT